MISTLLGGTTGAPYSATLPISGNTEPVLLFGTGGGAGSPWQLGSVYGTTGANGGLYGGGGGGGSVCGEAGYGFTYASGGTGGQGIVVVTTYF